MIKKKKVWWDPGLLALFQRYFILDVGTKHENYPPPKLNTKSALLNDKIEAPAAPALKSCHYCNLLIDSRERISWIQPPPTPHAKNSLTYGPSSAIQCFTQHIVDINYMLIKVLK